MSTFCRSHQVLELLLLTILPQAFPGSKSAVQPHKQPWQILATRLLRVKLKHTFLSWQTGLGVQSKKQQQVNPRQSKSLLQLEMQRRKVRPLSPLWDIRRDVID